MFAFLAFCAIAMLFAMVSDTRNRLKRAEAALAEAAMRLAGLQRRMDRAAGEEQWSPGGFHQTSVPQRADEPEAMPEPEPEPAPEPELAPEPEPPLRAPEWSAFAHADERHARVADPRGLVSRFEEFFGRQLPIWAGGVTLATG